MSAENSKVSLSLLAKFSWNPILHKCFPTEIVLRSTSCGIQISSTWRSPSVRSLCFAVTGSLFPQTHSLQDMRQQVAVAAKIFIQRDYSNGTMCQFQTKFPSELETKIDKQQFEETIRTLNNLYAEAEKLGSQSFIEGCLACLTAYTVFLCMETHYEKVLKRIAKYIQEQNDKIYAPRGLLLTDPIERGLRVVSSHSL
ncbi:hypothetical protein CCH79_00009931 [Gambusia affinis]|uniref:Golgin subfamily A member 7 n=1 Tax=Gambusia affinis TaxID=33528 RepID=A0A315V5S1_GAMAF|nr:hypothetical protein CCH79_00009931 [Gambusia affinis]